ncbi:leucine-rich repeat-containing protein 56 [Myripristis murdjan]|uniref:Leucine rich repeat containing 56 n=1 Tax=Myripristis murdjan TaxID=586833 RepID=A0A668AMV5_9TELE|nr:leucine-rich repeat-containing protein 56 [Myripristis murdjan]
MSCSHGSVPQVRPGTPRVVVTEFSGSGPLNPTPASKEYEDAQAEVEPYLSPNKLASLCGTQDLCQVTSLEICVDTRNHTLGNFGAYLPKLVQLNMNNSVIMSVRDLGTTLSHLQELWMSHCCLQDLEGITSFFSLKELYVPYNSVSDLSQVMMLENLQLLDLEGNDVDDLAQVSYLGLCSQLDTLTLEGNPVCVRPNPTATQTTEYRYRAAVRELVPQLRYLDNVRAEDDGPSCSGIMGEDWAMLRNSIRDCNYTQAAADDEETEDITYPYNSSAKHPSSSLSCVRPMSSACPRPFSGPRPMSSACPRPLSGPRPMSATGSRLLSPPGSRPGSAESDPAAVDPDTSILTHGAGKILFCGNPVQALRARREKLRTAPTISMFTPHDLPIYVPEHTYDLEEPDMGERSDMFAELRAWRERHSKRLQAIEMEKIPQVLTIQHSDEEEEEHDDKDGLGVLKSSGSDEEDGEEREDMSNGEALSRDVARLSLSPDTTLFPSPPLSTTAAAGSQKPSGVRARRLQRRLAGGQPLPISSPAKTDMRLQWGQEVVRPKIPPSTHKPHRPTTNLHHSLEGSRTHVFYSTEMDASRVQSVNKHQPSKPLNRPTIMRPHTAMAALQKHQLHHTLQPSRGSSHLD